MSILIYNRKRKKQLRKNCSKTQREQRHSIFLPKRIMSKRYIYIISFFIIKKKNQRFFLKNFVGICFCELALFIFFARINFCKLPFFEIFTRTYFCEFDQNNLRNNLRNKEKSSKKILDTNNFSIFTSFLKNKILMAVKFNFFNLNIPKC